MAKLQNAFIKLSTGVVAAFSLTICAALGVVSLFLMARMQVEKFEENIPELLVLKSRHFLVSIFVAAVLAAVLLGLCAAMKKHITWKYARYGVGCAALFSILLSIVWMNSYTNVPTSDQGIVWSIAQQLAGVGTIDDWIYEYLRMHPYQSGMAMAMELFVRLFGENSFSWQILCACSAAACIVVFSCICARITNSPAAKILCAVMLLGFFPLSMYTTFIYGTLPGIALAALAVYAVIRECENQNGSIAWWGMAVGAFSMAMILYKGEEIFLLAAALTLITVGIARSTQRRKILAGAALLIVPIVVCNLWQGAAMHRLGMPNDPGCPLLPRILMGVDAYSEVPVPGFYNGIHEKVFRECHYDAAEANRVCVTHIRNSLVALHKQGRFLAFFGEKIADQWLEPWFGGLTMSNPAIYNEPNRLAQSMIGGKLFATLNGWLSTLVPIVYLAAAGGVVSVVKKKKNEIWYLLPMICLIGGFLFQLASEAKSRYCMPYYLCCFPMAAAGVAALAEQLAKRGAGNRAQK